MTVMQDVLDQWSSPVVTYTTQQQISQ